MMHVRVSLITTDPQVLAGCIGYLKAKGRPMLETQHGSLGLSLLARQEGGVAIVESFWATHDAFWLSAETDALVRGELARRVKRPVTAEDYEVPVFERGAPLRSGEAVRLTRVEVKLPGVLDVIDVYGDTAVPRLADTPGFRAALLFAAPASGHLISQTVWRDPAARAVSPSVAGIIRSEVLAEEGCEIRAVEDYSLVFNSARKATVPRHEGDIRRSAAGRRWWRRGQVPHGVDEEVAQRNLAAQKRKPCSAGTPAGTSRG